jgi:glycosyltransferase involved in cell wall biosynthesis
MEQHGRTHDSAGVPASRSLNGRPLRVAVVSTYPPRQCGIATFSANLSAAMTQAEPGLELAVAAIEHSERTNILAPAVAWQIAQGDRRSFLQTASALNRSLFDAVCVQHEFGLYGNGDGEYNDNLGPFLGELRIPAVTTLHTVLPEPEAAIRAAVRDIGAKSASVVVMTKLARELLVSAYGVAPGKIAIIPHGVPVMHSGGAAGLRRRLGITDRTLISTFGLVDPRKGLQFMVEAMDAIRRRHPEAIYLILGRTHPELVAHEGERYRQSLEALIAEKGLRDHVRLVDEYLSEQEIVDYLAATDIYVTPYLDANQITSGTLAYALGAGKAIVSTPYLHATEALGEDRGLLAAFRSSDALATAVLRIIEEPGLRARLEINALKEGKQFAWPIVGAAMLALLRQASGARTDGRGRVPRRAVATQAVAMMERAAS